MKIKENEFNLRRNFIDKYCPRSKYFCDGTAISDRKIKSIGVCQHYDIDKGCTHPRHPNWVTK